MQPVEDDDTEAADTEEESLTPEWEAGADRQLLDWGIDLSRQQELDQPAWLEEYTLATERERRTEIERVQSGDAPVALC